MNSTTFRWLGGALVLTAAITACSSSPDRDGASDTLAAHTTTAADTTTTVESSTTTTVVVASSTSTTAPPPVTAAGAVPGAVTIVSAGAGGGSGEVVLRWNATADATGYRVFRAPAPGGPWTQMVWVNVVTGAVTAHADVVNLWAENQNFLPGPYTSSGASSWFEYVELTPYGAAYYKVVAFNATGVGPAGAVVCAASFGSSC